MHIHGAHLNPNLLSGASDAAFAARRAGSTRKKLANVEFQLEPLAGPESGWAAQMAQAWPDNQPDDQAIDPSADLPKRGNNATGSESQSPPAQVSPAQPAPAQPAPNQFAPAPRPAAAAVSFWA